jgi:hypothetical protein
MDKHSQNNMFDPAKSRDLTNTEYLETDKVLSSLGLPFTTKTSMDEFRAITQI